MLEIDKHKISNLGNVVRAKRTMNIEQYCNFIKCGEKIKIKFKTKDKVETKQFVFTGNASNLRKLYPIYEKMHYLELNGLILTQLSYSIVESLCKYDRTHIWGEYDENCNAIGMENKLDTWCMN